MKAINDKFKIYNQSHNLIGMNNELKAMYCNFVLEKTNKNVIYVTNTLYEANKFYQYLINYSDNVLLFPMDEFITSEALAISPELKTKRIETLIQLLDKNPHILVTNLMGFLRYLPTREVFRNSIINLEQGIIINPKELASKLISLGYNRETIVNKTGEFAIRGFVIDIYPVDYDNPIRIEFFGDEIDSIRIFDINDQLSKKIISQVNIYPNTETIGDNNHEILKHSDLPKYIQAINISQFAGNEVITIDNYQNLSNSYENLLTEINDYNINENRSLETKYMNDLSILDKALYINFTNFDVASSKKEQYFLKEINQSFDNIESINKTLNKYLKFGNTVVVALTSRNKIIKLSEELDNKSIIITNENELFENKINIINKKIIDSFQIDNLVVISQKDLFSSKGGQDSYKSNFRFGTKIKDINKLNIGDYVVHTAHGIGRYLGLTTLTKNGLKKDYLLIEYKNNDKLYIPVEKIDLISKYSSGEGSIPKLSKLGGTEWQKTKLKVRKKVENIASDLLKLYAIREHTSGFAFLKDDKEQIEFEKSFAYTETEDQLKVLAEIKKDMEKSMPMDRLLCGDVGYGKTEIAFRAAFKAVLSGKQVAFLCPTTILSNQHYLNALERFKDYPINISLLNRFITEKNIKKIKHDLEDGKIDIVFGTHRLLSDDISFKDLGLLIIDEEQRFGVKHKEKIKALKTNVDVLTLSATPIPRTLQMSMTGIKNLSLIETPPVNRFPIQTYVLSENNQIIKDAIYKELSREGQVFILYNKIEDMEKKKSEIQSLVPEARVVVAHGKMDKTELENVMFDFTNKEYDIMLCTTIIETGIDIPNVNTLIIIDADRFGLSQLYQIRGRVGRSDKIAYCYLMYNKHKILTEVAEKRLKAIKEFTELGSGFAIAMRDLSIRGAGDILGSEQAGFVDSVGLEMFLRLLEEEINKQKGILIEEEKEEQSLPLLDVSTSISNEYVEDEELKIYIHQKINEIDSFKNLEKIKAELTDRFGTINDDIIIYMYEELFEKMAAKLKIKEIKQFKNFIEVWLPLDLAKNLKVDNLFVEVTQLSRMFRFSMKGNRLVITLDTIKLDKHFIYYLIDLLNIIEKNKAI